MIRTSQFITAALTAAHTSSRTSATAAGAAVPVPRCGASKVLLPKQRYSEERKAEVPTGLSGVFLATRTQPTFGITRKTITQWLKKTPEPAHRQGNPVRGQGQWCPRTRRGLVVRVAAQEQALALDDDVPPGPARSCPSPTATTARPPAGHFGSGCRRPTVSAAASVASGRPLRRSPGEDSPQCRQGDRADRAHGTLEQHPAPARRTLRPRDPFLLQERLVA